LYYFIFGIVIPLRLSMSAFIVSANITFRTLHTLHGYLLHFGRFWPSSGRLYNNIHGK